jgi:hypothetical protein
MTDIHKTWYERYSAGGHTNIVPFYFLQHCGFELGRTLATLQRHNNEDHTKHLHFLEKLTKHPSDPQCKTLFRTRISSFK